MKRLIAIVSMLLLSGCVLFAPSKADIARKSAGAETKQQLQAALGGPDEVTRLGPIEQWVYKASDGQVVFVILGEHVTLQVNNDLLKSDP